MNYILLTGAGFSRNWGGWLADECFEYLLSCSEITPVIRRELWKSKAQKLGFENTLHELRALCAEYQDDRHHRELSAFETMLEGMFHTMRIGFERVQFEPAHDVPRVGGTPYFVRDFLAKFDAIFTLNQDTLLEQQYRNVNLRQASQGKWLGLETPGLKEITTNGQRYASPGLYMPEGPPYSVTQRQQPYYKLHGSANWRRNGANSALLIMGGNKSSDIDAVPLLAWYREEFKRFMHQSDIRLMIIGYGFQDAHINAIIHGAGARIFIINPEGVDILDNAPSPDGLKDGMKLVLQDNIIGASRRSLADTLSGDTVERTKLTKFSAQL
jgi:SIR2-like domain